MRGTHAALQNVEQQDPFLKLANALVQQLDKKRSHDKENSTSSLKNLKILSPQKRMLVDDKALSEKQSHLVPQSDVALREERPAGLLALQNHGLQADSCSEKTHETLVLSSSKRSRDPGPQSSNSVRRLESKDGPARTIVGLAGCEPGSGCEKKEDLVR